MAHSGHTVRYVGIVIHFKIDRRHFKSDNKVSAHRKSFLNVNIHKMCNVYSLALQAPPLTFSLIEYNPKIACTQVKAR